MPDDPVVFKRVEELLYDIKSGEAQTMLKVKIDHAQEAITYTLTPYNGYDKFEIKNTDPELLEGIAEVFKKVAWLILDIKMKYSKYKMGRD